MSAPILIPGTQIALINPATGRFDDTLAPPSVVANAASAYSSAVAAAASAALAATYVGQAGGGPDAAAAAAAALAAQAAAETAAADAAAAQAAAEAAAAGAGGASQATIDASILAQVSPAGRSGDYLQLNNKPPLIDSPDDINAVALASVGAANGIASLDAQGHGKYAEAIPGSRFEVRCVGGVQPLRATRSTRTDIYFTWLMIAQPSYATGYAIPGDGWKREAW